MRSEIIQVPIHHISVQLHWNPQHQPRHHPRPPSPPSSASPSAPSAACSTPPPTPPASRCGARATEQERRSFFWFVRYTAHELLLIGQRLDGWSHLHAAASGAWTQLKACLRMRSPSAFLNILSSVQEGRYLT